MLRRLATLFAAALIAAGPGCASEPGAPELGRISGKVTSLDERAPLAGARLFLVDPSSNVPALPMTRTDAAGRYVISGIPAGWYYLVVCSDRQLLFDPLEGPLRVTGGGTLTRDFVLSVYPFLDPRLPVVRGRVLDAVTGRPLSGAYVSVGSSDMSFLFSGIGLPWESVSNELGEFTLSGVPVSFSGAHQPLGIYPIIATKRGYKPGATGSAMRGEWIPFPAPGDTVETTIALEPGDGSVRVTGQLTHEGRPVAGVPVCLAVVDTAVTRDAIVPTAGNDGGRRLAPRAAVPDMVTESDESGRFEIGNVPEGRYQVQAAYFPDDGWIATTERNQPSIDVGHSDLQLADIELLPAIVAVAPRPGATVTTGQPMLSWTTLPGVDVYRVAFSAPNSFLLTSFVETRDNMVAMPSGVLGDGDHARWAVYAYRSGRIVGGTEFISSFQVNSR